MANQRIIGRYEGLQSRLEGIDSDGCFFLALCSIAEEMLGTPIDLIDAVNLCYSNKLIIDKYTVQDAPMILNLLTGKQWTVDKVISLDNIIIGDHDYTIAVYENPLNGIRHFRRRYVDTLTSSKTVAMNNIVEYRIYRWR